MVQTMKQCSECLAGEIEEAAVLKVQHPNPDKPGLFIKKLVCREHFQMLLCDYDDEIKVLEHLTEG